MERLWSPWRHEYISQVSNSKSQADACIFCDVHRGANDEESLIVYRGTLNFVILNRYPYISGHLMIAPYEHLAELDAASKEITDELMDLAKRCQTALRAAYKPEGFNVGMNLGRVAGAGVADHFHLHMMPRWAGDTNFMSTIGETRVLSEDLATTYHKLRGKI